MNNRRATPQQRQAVRACARGCCEYCRSQERFVDPFEIDHIVPRIRGGETTLDNLALACRGCNSNKHDKIQGHDPATDNIVPLYHPRQQRWREHFEWDEDFTLIRGLTPTGRATVETLRLNRDERVDQRRILRMAGLHPPA